MSMLWVDDLEGFREALDTINRRWKLERTDVESSATLEISNTEYKVVVRATEHAKNRPNVELSHLELTFDINYQGIDEVLDSLEKLLGLKKEQQ